MSNFKHGMRKTPTYSSWQSMKKRCKSPTYKYYGGKGIGYSSHWETFANFFADMGVRPEGMTLDRIDNSKGYEPGNCKWSTCKEQSQNRSVTRWFEYDGRRQCVADWAAETGIEFRTIFYRLNHNWPADQVLRAPTQHRHKKHS